MNIPPVEIFKSRGNRGCEKQIEREYPDFYTFIKSNYPKYTWKESLYLFYNHLEEPPRCECGKYCKFINFVEGYTEYCSKECKYKSNAFKTKIKESHKNRSAEDKELSRVKRNQTCLKKYGTLCPGYEKAIQTNLKKYGVKNPGWTKESQEKIKQTNLKKYGVEYVLQNPEIRKKQLETMVEKYGVEYFWQLPYYNTYIDSSDIGCDIRRRKCPHPECNKCSEKWYEISDSTYNSRKQYHIEFCTRLYPVNRYRNSNTSIEQFIQDILLINEIEFVSNDREILKDLELDIYIPKYNIAIECNGIFWHSVNCYMPKDKNYHYNKYKRCKELGIELLTFWEDQIKLCPEKVESILLSKLGIYENKIDADKCEIKQLEYLDVINFINENSLFVNSNHSSVRLGLLYENDLIACMTFGKSRHFNGVWKIYNFCQKPSILINGWENYLIEYFIDNFHPDKIVYMSNNDIGGGGKLSDFIIVDDHVCSFWYIDKNKYLRYGQNHFNHKNLIKSEYEYSKDNTVEQILFANGYYKFFDSGRTKYVKTLNKSQK